MLQSSPKTSLLASASIAWPIRSSEAESASNLFPKEIVDLSFGQHLGVNIVSSPRENTQRLNAVPKPLHQAPLQIRAANRGYSAIFALEEFPTIFAKG